MTFLITCSTCSHEMKVPDRLRGKKARCRSCKDPILLEAPTETPEEPVAELEIPEDDELLVTQSDEPSPAPVAEPAGDRIVVECGQCANVIRVPPSFAGKQGQCKNCGQALSIPGGPVPEAPIAVPLAGAVADKEERDPLDAALEELGDDDALDLMITATCPKCGSVIRVPESFAGKMGRCKACQTPMKIPGGEEPELVDLTEVAPHPKTKKPEAGRDFGSGSAATPAGADGVVADLIANPSAGVGPLIGHAFKSAAESLVGIYRFALIGNLAVYVLFYLAAELLGAMFGQAALRSGGSMGAPQYTQLVFLVLILSVALAFKVGLANLAQGYLMQPARTHWNFGFSELGQVYKGMAIVGALVLLLFGFQYGASMLGRNLRRLLGLALPVLGFLVYARLALLPNEMAFQPDQGPLETVIKLNRLINWKRWLGVLALISLKLAVYFVVAVLISFVLAVSKLNEFIPRDPSEAKLFFHVIAGGIVLVMSFFEAGLEPLFAAFYLRFRLSPAR